LPDRQIGRFQKIPRVRNPAAERVLQDRHSEALAKVPGDVVLRLAHFARDAPDRQWFVKARIDDRGNALDRRGRFDAGPGNPCL
jgi:hypothetical protein